ncbi:MAG: AraC family transcriptional regulator [Pricia sp.]
MKLNKEGPVYFSYNVKGHFLHRFSDEDTFSDILQNQHLIVVGSTDAGAEIVYPPDTKLEIAVIAIDMATLGTVDVRNAKRIYSKVKEIFTLDHKDHPFRHLGSIDTDTKKYASLVCRNNDTDLIGELLTEGAVLNMFASQVQAYLRDSIKIGSVPVLRNSELARISSLRDYVMENLDQHLSVSGLSQKLDMSRKKLQVGVRHLYGNSVGQYVTNLRMGQAKQLMNTTSLAVRKLVIGSVSTT